MAITDEIAQGEAHMQAYEAALKRGDFGTAIREMVEAAKIDGRRFAPFAVGKYLPQRVLAASDSDVAFVCKHKFRNSPVVVKALRSENLDRDVEEILAEAKALQGIDHPAIARQLDSGYVEPESHGRPYLVTEYFDGVTLEEYVNNHGVLTPTELIDLVGPVAAGLEAAHSKDILHRNINPASLLVRCSADGNGNAQFIVMLVDCGLSIKRGPKDCVAPEQKQPGGQVTKASDVYSFARTCCLALFQTTQPSAQQWKSIPPMLADLLQRCVSPNPEDRPVDFAIISRCLERLEAECKTQPVTVPAVAVPPPVTVRTRIVSPSKPAEREDEPEEEYEEAPVRSGIPVWVWLVGAGGLVALIGVPVLVVILYLNRGSSDTQPDAVAQTNVDPSASSNHAQETRPNKQPEQNPFEPVANNAKPPVAENKLYTIEFQDVPTKTVADFVESRLKTELEYTKFPGSAEYSRDVKGSIKSKTYSGTTLSFKVLSSKSMNDIVRRTELGALGEEGDRLTVAVQQPAERPQTATNPLAGPRLTKAQMQTVLRNIQGQNLGIRTQAVRQLMEASPTEDSRTGVRAALRPLVQQFDNDAIKALGVWGTEDDVPILLQLGQQKAGDLGAAQPIIEALGKLRSAQAAQFLVSQLGNFFNGGYAFDALKLIGTPAEKAMQAALSNRDANIRIKACDFLKLYGTTGSIPALKPVTLDSDTKVSNSAWDAWRTIAYFGKAAATTEENPFKPTEENPFKPTEENPFKPSDDPFRPVIGAGRKVDDLSVIEVEAPAATLLPNMCVAADGKSFYAIDKSGELRRFGWDGKQLAKEPTNKCTVLTVSSEGVIVANSGDTKLLDQDSLTLKQSGPLATPKWIAASPSQSVAVARCEPPGILCVLDLGTFTVKPQIISDKQLATVPRAEPTLTPDGKYFFTRGGRLCRWKLENLKMVFSESGPTLGPSDSGQILISPDNKFVALFYPDGNKPDGDLAKDVNPGSTAVFAVGDLKKPVFQIAHGRGAFGLAFDATGAWASTPEHSLIHFGPDGKKIKEYAAFAGGPVKQLVVAADGTHAVLLTDRKLLSVQLPK
ncbi:MAG TPA: serine/threonine-protein kinase [Gemmataceae bacterium]|nr:serine/threonine-protein kinase [Gemmataceae bacterium]